MPVSDWWVGTTPYDVKTRLRPFHREGATEAFFNAAIEAEEQGENRPEILAALRREMRRRLAAEKAKYGP